MAAPQLQSSWRSKAASVALATLAAFAPAAANDLNAEPLQTAGISAKEAGELGFQAVEWARSGNGVSVLALIGNDLKNKGWTAQSAGEKIVGMFRDKHNVPAKAYVANNGDRPSTFVYYTRSAEYGPLSVGAALTAVQKASEQYVQERNIASLDLEQK